MLLRIIVGVALIVMATGFLWFMAQVIYLGVREFFKIHSSSTSATHKKQRGRTAPN